MLKKYHVHVMVSFLFISCISYAQQVEVIAIEYAPFTSAKLPHGGLAFEILSNNELTKQIQWKPLFLPPKRAGKMINEGRWCASFIPVLNKHARFIQYKLSDEQVKLGLIRLARDDDFKWQTLTDLQGKTIAILRTTDDSPFARQFIDAGLQVVFVESVELALRMVMLKRVDFAFADSQLIARTKLSKKERLSLQFSHSLLQTTPVSVFINADCNIKLPNKLIYKQQ